MAACGHGGTDGAAPGDAAVTCSDAVYRTIEERVGSGDGRGHGPDVGSDEWKSTIEFRLGLRASGKVPPRDSDAWCDYIDRQIRGDKTLPHRMSSAWADVGPSLGCKAVDDGSSEALVCGGGSSRRSISPPAGRSTGSSAAYVAEQWRATNARQ